MNETASYPKMMTIRQVAATGILSEYALRLMYHQGKLPCITVGNKALINFDALLEQLQNLQGTASSLSVR